MRQFSRTRRGGWLRWSGSVTVVVDIDAAIGYVVAHGDPVERARLSFLRTRQRPAAGDHRSDHRRAEPGGGWPASGDGPVPSVDATCFRLGELDDLGGLHGPAVDRALNWLAGGPARRRHLAGGRVAGRRGAGLGDARRSGGHALPDRGGRLLAGRGRGRGATRTMTGPAVHDAVIDRGRPVRAGPAAPGRHLAVVPGRRLARRRCCCTSSSSSTSRRASSWSSATGCPR